jgi:PAS domain S-box-containing protein
LLGSVIAFALFLLARSLRSRDRAQARLRANQEHTRAIIGNANQAYYEVDSQGIVLEWNTQAEEMFGWERSEVVGHQLVDILVLPERRDVALGLIEKLVRDDSSEPGHLYLETRVITRNGRSPKPVAVNMWKTVIGDEVHVSALLLDISERRRLDEEREQLVRRQRHLVEELRQADKVKSDFISTVSHELRTPLTSIIGYLEMLRDGFGGDLTDQQGSMLDVVDRNSRRLLGLIDDVLTLSRLESNVIRGANTSVDVSSLVVSAQQAVLPSMISRELRFEADIADDVGSVFGDVNQLERVLLNLLTNAVKFTPDGGEVRVGAQRDQTTVTIEVSDTGIGIPQEEQDRLFSRFFRASSAQDHAIQGTGLGLTIVKSIVERHGGSVSIRSTLDVGTTVTVELPVPQSAIAGEPVSSYAGSSGD